MSKIDDLKKDLKDLKKEEAAKKAEAKEVRKRLATLKLLIKDVREGLKDARQAAKAEKAAAPKAKRGRKPKAKPQAEAPKQEAPKQEAPKAKVNYDEMVARELASKYNMHMNMTVKEYNKVRWAYMKDNHPDNHQDNKDELTAKCASANMIIDRMIKLAKDRNRAAA